MTRGERRTMPLLVAIGMVLREARENYGLTREDLSERMGGSVEPRTIRTYEHATRGLTIKRLDELCDALKIDMIQLLRLARLRIEAWNARQLLHNPEVHIMTYDEVAAVAGALGGVVDPDISGPLGEGKYAIRAYFPDVGIADAFRVVAATCGMKVLRRLSDPDSKTVEVTFDVEPR